MKRAAIYIRCSTELQAEKVSPEIQQSDCENYCVSKGYSIVAYFKDVENYKSGGKVHAPSGSRADRPGYIKMLKAAYNLEFDVIVSWREDRLYRNNRSVIDLLDCMEESGVDVELAKEHFDKSIAVIKAWAAGLELGAKKDRQKMGLQGRLMQGKDFTHPPFYGYSYRDNEYIINEPEAAVVRIVYEMYAGGASLRNDIRPRLIAEGHKQRETWNKRHVWALDNIYHLLRKADVYATGEITRDYQGQTYRFQFPPLISRETAALIHERMGKFSAWKAGNDNETTLAGGLVYCEACRRNMHKHTTVNCAKSGKYSYTYYMCRGLDTIGERAAGCAGQMRAEKVDALIWEKIYTLLATEGALEKALSDKVAEIQAQNVDVTADIDRLTARLENLSIERQRVISWAREGIINKDDLQTQLFTITISQNETTRELSEKRLLAGDKSKQFAKIAKHFQEKYSQNLDLIKDIPTDDPEKAAVVFATRRGIVRDLVSRVIINPDKTVKVLLSLENEDENAKSYVDALNTVYRGATDNNKISLAI